MKRKQIRVRCWVYIDGEKFFGPGRVELLDLIEKSGSISKAAKAMGMSYKKAWIMIDDMNRAGQKPYVICRAGGSKGGGAEVTETGKKAIAAYHKLADKLNAIISKETELLKLI